MCCDSGQPPIAILRRALTSAKSQIGRVASGGTRWIALRTDKKPFDNLNVRKAVIAAFDREALLLTRGGKRGRADRPALHPAGRARASRSRAARRASPSSTGCRTRRATPTLAKQYMLKAKAEGVPVTDDGKLHGRARSC